MHPSLLIAGKDLRQRVRDRSAFIWGIIAPLGLAAIFSFVFNPVSENTFHAEYVVVDQDGGPVAQGFFSVLSGMENEGVITVRSVDSVAEATAQVEVGSDAFASDDEPQADAAFIIPAGFSDAILAGGNAEMTVIGAAGSELGAQVALAMAEGYAAELHAVNVAVKTALPVGTEPSLEQVGGLIMQAQAVPNPISVDDISADTKQLDGTTQMTAGMAVFFVFFTVAFGVSGLLEERRLNTMTRLKAAPLTRNAIILGKALTSFILGIVSMVILVISTTILLGADWGPPVGVALLVVSVVIAAMGVLAVVASVAKTQEQAGIIASIIALVFGLLGGTFFPVSQVGGLLATLSLVAPHAWFMRGLGDIAGGDVSAVWPSVIALLAFGVITCAASWTFLQKAVSR